MKNSLLLLITAFTFFAFATVQDDRVEHEIGTYIKHSENFEYICNVDFEGLRTASYWVDEDFPNAVGAPSVRVASKVIKEAQETVLKLTGERVVGKELVVMSSNFARGPWMNLYINIGTDFYEKGVLETGLMRVYQSPKKQKVIIEYTVYDYDDNYVKYEVGQFQGECEANEPY